MLGPPRAQVLRFQPRPDIHDDLGTVLSRIACRFDIPLELPHLPLTAEQRHEVFLVFNEALNNIIKHSAATEVKISLHLANGAIRLVIANNGRGFETSAPPDGKGNGLHNMRNRLHRLGGTVEIQSMPAGGTRVEIVQPIHARTQADD